MERCKCGGELVDVSSWNSNGLPDQILYACVECRTGYLATEKQPDTCDFIYEEQNSKCSEDLLADRLVTKEEQEEIEYWYLVKYNVLIEYETVIGAKSEEDAEDKMWQFESECVLGDIVRDGNPAENWYIDSVKVEEY